MQFCSGLHNPMFAAGAALLAGQAASCRKGAGLAPVLQGHRQLDHFETLFRVGLMTARITEDLVGRMLAWRSRSAATQQNTARAADARITLIEDAP